MASRRGIPQSARVSFEGHYGGQPWANVIWLLTAASTTVTPGLANSLAAAMFNIYNTRFPAAFVNNWQIERCRVTYFPDDPNLVVFGEHVQTVVGGIVGNTPTPANVALVLSWFASVYWRGGKPRTYLCGLPQSDLQGTNQITAAARASFQTRAQGFMDDINSFSDTEWSSVTFGLMSFRHKKADRDPPVFFPIISSSVGARLDSQRRRLGREII